MISAEAVQVLILVLDRAPASLAERLVISGLVNELAAMVDEGRGAQRPSAPASLEAQQRQRRSPIMTRVRARRPQTVVRHE